MTQEERQLLLKDLCGRLPYGVMGLIHNVNCDDYNISIVGGDIDLFSRHFMSIKPYLRPMSSMTEEERKEHNSHRLSKWSTYSEYCANVIDWLNAHHFDYRGLIDMGLAIKVTPENNPYESR